MDIEEFRAKLDKVPILDTHEHFLPLPTLTSAKNILGQVIRNTYLGIDCIVSGSPRDLWEPGSMVHTDKMLPSMEELPPLEWEDVMPAFLNVQFTSYFKSMMVGLERLYGINPTTDLEKWRQLEKIVTQAYQDQTHFESGLKEAGIRFVLRDPYFAVADPQDWSDRVSSVFRVDDFIGSPWYNDPHKGNTAADIANTWNMEINTLDDMVSVLEHGFARYMENESKAVKTATAYRREIHFNPITRTEAERAFRELKKDFDPQMHRALGNFMIREVIKLCIEWDKPLQIHTGMNYGALDKANPVKAVNLFQEFPEVDFVLFHGGYPYTEAAALLAKTFPNVYLDLVWMPQLSRGMTVEMIGRWIDLVPVNKIMWGGDVWTIEECVGSAHYFKDVLASGLYKKYTHKQLNGMDCIEIANNIMWRNALERYKLEDLW